MSSSILFRMDDTATTQFARFLKDVDVPGNTLAEIDDALQARFFQKNPDGERWELTKVLAKCPDLKFRRYLQLLGFISAKIPREWFYNRAAWPGDLLSRAALRLIDLADAWKSGVRWNETVMFGGKRLINKERENPTEAMKALGLNEEALPYLDLTWQQQNPTTELGVMKWLWLVSEVHRKIPEYMCKRTVTFVDAPMKPPIKNGGPEACPDIEDTILHWLEKDMPHSGSMLVSCGAPYNMAIGEAFEMHLHPRAHIVDVFGRGAFSATAAEQFMREIAEAVHRIRRHRGV